MLANLVIYINEVANISIYCILYNHVANYSNMIKILSKLYKSSSSTTFIQKTQYKNVMPTFAKVKGQLLNGNVK